MQITNKSRRYIGLLFALFLSAFITACGRGGEESPASERVSSYAVSLSPAEQNPPVLSVAGGSGTFRFDPANGSLTGSVTTANMTGSAARLQLGDIGVNGTNLVSLTESPAGSGVWVVPASTVLSADQRAALTSGSIYVNVVSATFPNGQVRGQIGRTVRTAVLNGSQENPRVTSAASGTGTVSVDPVTRAMTARVVTTGVVGTVAHIHTAAVGTNGPVSINLSETPAGSGVWTSAAGTIMSEQQYTDLLQGNMYFNVHSTANPGGEIRGQIGVRVLDAILNSAQEVPTNTSTATAFGRAVVDLQTLNLSGTITTTGVTGTVAHIHTGVFGVNGGVTYAFTQTTAGGNVWTMPVTVMTTAQYQSLLFGDMYFNVHSAAFPGGEIRGQIGRVTRTATLSGAQEVPANTSAATGRGIGTYDPITGAASFSVTSTVVNPTAAHIHTAVAGSNGGVTVGFTQTSPGTWTSAATATLTPTQAIAFASAGMYFNVHSAAFPGGEVRGQATGRD